jgi:glycosyltransferase involved in cell wall biosynthesis
MTNHSSNEPPFVSLVMAIRNEAAYIRRSLECLLSQDYPAHRMELIVADGMSDDGTPQAIRSLQEQHPNLRLLENPKKTTATGLNTAILAARGDVIVRMDGHSEIRPDYVRNFSGRGWITSGVRRRPSAIRLLGKPSRWPQARGLAPVARVFAIRIAKSGSTPFSLAHGPAKRWNGWGFLMKP